MSQTRESKSTRGVPTGVRIMRARLPLVLLMRTIDDPYAHVHAAAVTVGSRRRPWRARFRSLFGAPSRPQQRMSNPNQINTAHISPVGHTTRNAMRNASPAINFLLSTPLARSRVPAARLHPTGAPGCIAAISARVCGRFGGGGGHGASERVSTNG